MEAADAKGGDSRCTCESEPKVDAPCDGKTAHVAYLLRADRDDPSGSSFNDGTYSVYLSVTDRDIKRTENANPVKTLRNQLRSATRQWIGIRLPSNAGRAPGRDAPFPQTGFARPDVSRKTAGISGTAIAIQLRDMGSPSAMAQKLAAVVVTLPPKTHYTTDEEISFRHVRHFLGRYDKYVLIPDRHPAVYPGFVPKRFPARFFRSPRAHKRLLLSEQFYKAFLDYEFILVYDLDALVFSDELADWCRSGYDYIGARSPSSPGTPHIAEQKVGSGGFSLRRVRSFLRVLRSRRYFVEPEDYWSRYVARTSPLVRLLNTPRRYLKRLHRFNDVRWHVRWALRGDVREDRFWAECATRYDPSFTIAPLDVAMRFAFEAEPRTCYERIGRRRPFGCHRWHQLDRAFYEPFLLRHGAGSDVRIRIAREARRVWDHEWSAVALLASRPNLPPAILPQR